MKKFLITYFLSGFLNNKTTRDGRKPSLMKRILFALFIKKRLNKR